jgi:hypothetical protein
VTSYRMYAFYRTQIFAIFALFAVVAVVMLATTASDSGPPLPFLLLWIAIAIFNGYWFLFRIVYELELDDQILRWRTPLRRGSVALLDIAELRPFRLGSNIEIIELDDGTRLRVFVRKGFRAFADELAAQRPGLPVRLGFQARMTERMPGWSGFRRDRGESS